MNEYRFVFVKKKKNLKSELFLALKNIIYCCRFFDRFLEEKKTLNTKIKLYLVRSENSLKKI